MSNRPRSLIDTKTLMVPVVLTVLLIFSSQISFILFHTLAESFAIFVAMISAVVVWQMYAFTRNHFLMYLGCGYFWIALLDMMHTLTYKGMDVFPVTGTEIAVQFWIATRYLEAVLLLTAPWFLAHSLKRNLVFSLFAVVATGLLMFIMSGYFPAGFVEGKGLTGFKIYSEYIIICILAASIFYLNQQRKLIDQRVFVLMIVSIAFTMIAELAFTFYIDAYGLSNLAGHIFKLLSFWLIFVAIIRTTLREPFSALSKSETHYDAVPDATVIIDDQGVIQHVNKAAGLLANKSTIELIGQNVHSVFHGEGTNRKDCTICQSITKRIELSAYELKINDALWCDFSTSIIHGENAFIEVIRNITNKKTTASALEKSDVQLRTLTNALPDLIWLKDPDGVYLSCNGKFERFFGAKENEIVGKTDYDFVDKELADLFRKNDKLAMDIGEPSMNEEEVVYADDGHKEFLETIKTPMFSIDGKLIGVLGISHDITERKKMEDVLQENAYNLLRAQEIAKIGNWKLNPETNQVEGSKELFNIFELGDDETTLDCFVDVVHPDDRESNLKCIQNGIEQGTSWNIDHRLLLKDGSIKWVHAVGEPMLNNAGKTTCIIGIVQDITQQKMSEKTIAKSFKEWTLAMDFFEDAIYLINLDDKLIRANKTFYRMTGLTPESAIDHDITTILHPEGEEIPCPVCKARKERRDEVVIMEADNPDNTTGRPIQITVQIIRDNEGIPLSILMGIRDLSSIRAAEEENAKIQYQLHQSQKMDALGNLTGGIAHDYNNMLGVIMGYAELLEELLNEQPELAKYAHEINHAGKRGAKLTKKLLAFSQVKASEAEAEGLDLNTLLKNEQHMLEKTLTVRIKLVFNLQESLWPVCLDHSDMEDAILNISINAMHAIEGNGQLTIQTSNQKINQIDAQSLGLTSGEYVLLSITDTGCGMDEATRDKIFEPFFSTKGEKGTGLGLSQVYGFVRRSGGVIKVYSELNHGTQFAFYFPRYYESEHFEQSAEDYPVTTFEGHERILVVDDEPALLDLTSKILGLHGFNVITAKDAKKALDILQHETVDVLISDIIMPEMNGYELAAIVKEKYPGIKIQLVSGFSDDRNMEIVDENLHRNLLFKPFESQVLLKRIQELIDDK